MTPREWGLYKNLNSLLKLFLSYLKRLFPLSDYHLSLHYQEYTHLRITYPLNTLKTNYITINSSTYSIPSAIADTVMLQSIMLHYKCYVTIINSFEITNAFNIYFAKLFCCNVHSSKRFLSTFRPYLLNIFIDSTEVSNTTSLNLWTKILKLLNKDISDQLAFLFKQPFSSGFFLSILKTCLKIILIYI